MEKNIFRKNQRGRLTGAVLIIFAALFWWYFFNSGGPGERKFFSRQQNPIGQPMASHNASKSESNIQTAPADYRFSFNRVPIDPKQINFVGPIEDEPKDFPDGEGFWSFAIPVEGVFSRSGQPKLKQYQWLKQQGWNGVIDLREPDEYGEKARDTQIKGFEELGFNYLEIPIEDGAAPTDEQAQQFLNFVTNPANQPVHIHCRGGYGRTGTMTAIYRYAVQGWPMDEAIKESRLFKNGVSDAQKRWLEKWAKSHP